VGLSGDSYRYGLRAGAVELGTVICLGFASAVLLPYYIKNKIFTIPEFLEIRYNATARTLFSGLMLIVCIMTKAAFTLFAGALVLHSLVGWEVMNTVAVMAVLVAVVTMIGGFTTVAYTDSIQAVIKIVGCGVICIVGLVKVGGWSALCAKVPDAIHIAGPIDDPNYPFWGIIAATVYGGIFYWGMDQVNVQRMLGARDLNQARWGAMFAALLKLTPVFIFALPGVIALALYPGRDSKTTFVTMLNEMAPTGVRGLLLASLLAAITSSLLAIMNSISTLIVHDFIMRYRPKTSDRGQVFFGRLAILFGAFMAYWAAYLVYHTPGGLYKYLQTISIYLLLPVTPAIAMGILSKRVTLKGAAASVAVGVLLSAIMVIDELVGAEKGAKIFPWLHQHYLMVNYSWRGLWGTIIIIIVMFAVSAFTAKTSPEKLAHTTIDWGKKPEPFMGLKDWRLQLAAIGVVTILFYAWLW
jgi:solute:Na+ symporter, SSS family